MHDPRVGRFFAVDPLFREYPHNSVYAFSENRVIDSGELEGLERYYNAYGRFKEQKGESKIPLVRIGDNSYPLSRLDYNQIGTRIAVSKVIADQAMLRGYKGYYGVQNMVDEKGKPDNDTGAYTNKAKTVVVNGNQLQHGVYDNDFDLGSTLDHEEGHKNENIPQNKYTFVNHANVYLEQSKASDFSNTSKNNKYSVATGFVVRTYNAYLN